MDRRTWWAIIHGVTKIIVKVNALVIKYFSIFIDHIKKKIYGRNFFKKILMTGPYPWKSSLIDSKGSQC